MGRQAMTDDAALTTLLRAIRDSFHAFDRYAIAFACGDAAARIEALVGERDAAMELCNVADGQRDAAEAGWLKASDLHRIAVERAEAAEARIAELDQEVQDVMGKADKDCNKLHARVAELERERDEALCLAEGPSTLLDIARGCNERGMQLAAAAAALEKAREVIEPFATAIHANGLDIRQHPSIWDFRAALRKATEGEKGE